MFTGLISDVGAVSARSDTERGARLRIACAYDPASIDDGASIACSGACLTAVAIGGESGNAWFDVDVSPETLDRTTARDWQVGTRLNLERSLKLGDELGGHLVTGHVDAVTEIMDRQESGDYTAFTVGLPPALAPLVAEKGSVALDGTSLTVNSTGDDRFTVMVIPHTLKVTTWGEIRAGDRINIEVDLMARYAARLMDARGH